MALSQDDVRDQLRATVDGRISVEQLENWLVAASWNLHLTDTPRDVQDVLRAVDHDLATRLNDVAVLVQLQRRLLRLDAPPIVMVEWNTGAILDGTIATRSVSTSDARLVLQQPPRSRGSLMPTWPQARRRRRSLPQTA